MFVTITATVLALVLLWVFSAWMQRGEKAKQQEYESLRSSQANDHINTIFVSIPCYKDENECAQTLFSLFNEADCPWRVFVGIVQHTDNAADAMDGIMTNITNLYEQVCQQHGASSFLTQIRFSVHPAHEARGPMVARRDIETNLFRRERFYMTIDSHMRLERHWDSVLLQMYEGCFTFSKQPILTTYPANFVRELGMPSETRPTFLAIDGVDNDGFPRPCAMPFVQTPVRPFQSLFIAPCFMFASSRLLNDVPYDGAFPLIFFPEMYLHSARCWTSGWDFFTPTKAIAYHVADRDYRPTYWEQLQNQKDLLPIRVASIAKALVYLRKDECKLCGEKRFEHPFGHVFESLVSDADTLPLGRVRSLKEFEEYCGVTIGQEPQPWTKLGCRQNVSDEEQMAKLGKVYDLK
jgi:hypothetical protein